MRGRALADGVGIVGSQPANVELMLEELGRGRSAT
jgi:hypothetical protein